MLADEADNCCRCMNGRNKREAREGEICGEGVSRLGATTPTIRPWHPDRLNARSEFTISEDENDLNKPWRYEEDGLHGHAHMRRGRPRAAIR